MRSTIETEIDKKVFTQINRDRDRETKYVLKLKIGKDTDRDCLCLYF